MSTRRAQGASQAATSTLRYISQLYGTHDSVPQLYGTHRSVLQLCGACRCVSPTHSGINRKVVFAPPRLRRHAQHTSTDTNTSVMQHIAASCRAFSERCATPPTSPTRSAAGLCKGCFNYLELLGQCSNREATTHVGTRPPQRSPHGLLLKQNNYAFCIIYKQYTSVVLTTITMIM